MQITDHAQARLWQRYGIGGTKDLVHIAKLAERHKNSMPIKSGKDSKTVIIRIVINGKKVDLLLNGKKDRVITAPALWMPYNPIEMVYVTKDEFNGLKSDVVSIRKALLKLIKATDKTWEECI